MMRTLLCARPVRCAAVSFLSARGTRLGLLALGGLGVVLALLLALIALVLAFVSARLVLALVRDLHLLLLLLLVAGAAWRGRAGMGKRGQRRAPLPILKAVLGRR
jgi:hypothetical protein